MDSRMFARIERHVERGKAGLRVEEGGRGLPVVAVTCSRKCSRRSSMSKSNRSRVGDAGRGGAARRGGVVALWKYLSVAIDICVKALRQSARAISILKAVKAGRGERAVAKARNEQRHGS